MFTADAIRRLTRSYVTLSGLARVVPVLMAFQIVAASRLMGLSMLTDVAVWGGLAAALVLVLLYRRRYGVVVAEQPEVSSYRAVDWLLGLAVLLIAVPAAILAGVRAGLNLYEIGLVFGGAGIVLNGASVGGYHRSWLVPAVALALLTLSLAVPDLSPYRAACHLLLVGTSAWAWIQEHRRFTRRLANAC